MKVLILTQWYKPEPERLMHELAQSLIERGHEVTVLTGFPNYPSGKLYPGYKLRAWRRETLEGVPIVRVPLYPDHSQSKIRRVLNYLSFAVSAAIVGPWLAPKPDVIFAYHPPLTVAIPAILIGWLRRAPIVYQIQDMWPETLTATGMVNSPRLLRWVAAAARQVYRLTDAICVISPGFRKNLIEKGVPEEKIHTISNWVDTDVYYPVPADPALAQELGLTGRFNIMFAGNIGRAQGLDTVIQAAELLQDLEDVQFVIVGDGVDLEDLKQAAHNKKLSNVRFLGRYPQVRMPGLYALASVLFVHLRDDPLFRLTIPHKILGYMAAGKPVLGAVVGDAADLIEVSGAGIICAPSNPSAMADAVRQLWGMRAECLSDMATRGLEAARSRYNRERLVGKIEGILLGIMPPE